MDADVGFAIAAVLISVITFVVTVRETRRTEIQSRMPVVVFVWDPAAKIWSLRNIGNGPALNVIIAQHDRDGWYNSVRVPPLSRDGQFALSWLGSEGVYGLGARYSDFLAGDGHPGYFSYCLDDNSRVFVPQRSPAWSLPDDVLEAADQHWQQHLSWQRPTPPPP